MSDAEAVLSGGDTAWVLTSTAFVLFMTLPGLALFYGGLVRADSVLSVVVQCFAICCIASLLWFGCGYSLAFGDGGSVNPLIGSFDKSFLMGVYTETLIGTIPESVFFMFQMTFAIITPSLIVGAYPERVNFGGCLIFSAIWLMVVYVPVTHWVWGGGWLAQLGVMDFAGGIVVHCTAGVSGLVVAAFIGPRHGFPDKLKPPHSPVLTAVGAAMLWVGWFGFNAGSALTAGTSAGMAMTVTHMSAAAAAMSWATAEWFRTGKPTAVGLVTGMVAGLAAVTPASGFIGPLGGVLLGTFSGVLCEWMARVVKEKAKIDDSLDCFAVHGVGGMFGAICVSFLAHPAFQGLGMPYSIWSHLGIQCLAVAAVSAWTAVGSLLVLKAVDNAFGVRASLDDEIKGLDITAHGEYGYSVLQEELGKSKSAAYAA